ncbi:oxidoreductase [Burkholderia vietnamiensis]|uniref:phage tail protein n=1 Tax=Burkholderia vietnamiensis TaxID=60552 RepID=UPI000757D97B|nr:phage tail protein [Burkholderia vietnamiensis]KVE64666.1 oxidoreductase [Burkholderia vietnamiensis]
MMMALGLFVFSLSTLPYQELKRRRGWRFASNNRVGRKPARQYVGEDDETISLSGVLLPELTGGDMSLAVIEAMAGQHTAWPLIEGTGHIYGMFTIDNIDTTRTLFFDNGTARRIEFSIALTRNDDLDMLGIVTDAIKEAISL